MDGTKTQCVSMTLEPYHKTSLEWTIHHAHQLFHRRPTPSDFHLQLDSQMYVFQGLHLRLLLQHTAEQHAFLSLVTIGAGTADLASTPTFVTLRRKIADQQQPQEQRWIRWVPSPSLVEKVIDRPQFFFSQRQLSGMIDRNTNTATFELLFKCQMPRSYAITPLHFFENWQRQMMNAWQSGVLFDVNLSLSENDETMIVRANKQMLAAQSPVFQAMFQSAFKECTTKHPIVKITEREVTVRGLEAFVEFVCLGSVDKLQKLTDWQDAFAVLRMCQYYGIAQLLRLSVLPTLFRLIRPPAVLPILSWLNLSAERRELWGLELRSQLAEYSKHDPLLILDTACSS